MQDQETAPDASEQSMQIDAADQPATGDKLLADEAIELCSDEMMKTTISSEEKDNESPALTHA